MLGGEHNGNEEEEAVDGLVTNVVGPFDVRGAPFETETDEHNHEDEGALQVRGKWVNIVWLGSLERANE